VSGTASQRHPGHGDDRDWTQADYQNYMECNRDGDRDGCDPDGAVLAGAIRSGRLAAIGIKAPEATIWPPVMLTAEEATVARRDLTGEDGGTRA